AFLTDAHGRDHVSKAKMAFDENHKIVGFQVDTLANLGAYMSLFSSSVPTYLYATLLSGQYNIPNIHCNVKTVYTNTVPVDAYRGAGRPEATYLVERMMTTAARELGVDPAELRRIQRSVEITRIVAHDDRCLVREFLHEILAAQFCRVHAQFAGSGGHHPLHQIGG
ncbi:MAG: molybdopterin cofactor-binding domain-containing protein, partial [Pseudomonadota bacterium]